MQSTSADRTFSIVDASFLLVVAIAVAAVASDMLPALVWGGVLAIALRPLHRRLALAIRPGPSAAAIIGAIVLALGGVFWAASQNVVNEIMDLRALGTDGIVAAVIGFVHAHIAILPPQIARLSGFLPGDGTIGVSPDSRMGESLLHSGTPLFHEAAPHLLAGLHMATHAVETLAFALISALCFLSGYDRLSAHVLAVSRRLLGRDDVMRHAVTSVRGAVVGLVLVGIGEGLVIAPAYAIEHVPHATLAVMAIAVAAMIPFVGPVVAAMIAAVTYLTVGAGPAFIVLGCALAVLFAGDHFIRPVFIGRATKLPFLPTIISVLGGLHLLGILGLFIGPAVMAVGYMLWLELAEDEGSP